MDDRRATTSLQRLPLLFLRIPSTPPHSSAHRLAPTFSCDARAHRQVPAAWPPPPEMEKKLPSIRDSCVGVGSIPDFSVGSSGRPASWTRMMASTCAMAKANARDHKSLGMVRTRKKANKVQAKPLLCAATGEAHGAFVRDTAKADVPAHLEALLGALEASGKVLLDPNDRQGIFPLAIPLSKDVETGEVLALLRWPHPDRSHVMPVVSLNNTCGVALRAQDATQMLHRMLVEEDVAVDGGMQSSRPVAEAMGYLGAEFYTQGDFGKGELPRLAAYITKHVGHFPDVCESLIQTHLDKGDTMSAMITADWYAGRFPHWGSPHVFSSKLYRQLGRLEEARDEARKALLKPWWTLGDDWNSVMTLAEFDEENAESLHEKIFHLQNQEKLQAKLTNQETTLVTVEDEAMWVLDKESSRGCAAQWDAARSELAAKFREKGRPDMASFVLLE